jgi:hypothetical protein
MNLAYYASASRADFAGRQVTLTISMRRECGLTSGMGCCFRSVELLWSVTNGWTRARGSDPDWGGRSPLALDLDQVFRGGKFRRSLCALDDDLDVLAKAGNTCM